MHALALLALSMVAAAGPRSDHAVAPANLLAGPARCVLRYLEAVRSAGPHLAAAAASASPPTAREQDYARAKELTSPRTLAQIEKNSARGLGHPLAPWQDVARSRVLEAFQLLAVRRAPRGTAVVTVAEHWWRPRGTRLAVTVSEYFVARVRGDWRVVDRRPGGAFEDAAIANGYSGYFDEPSPHE